MNIDIKLLANALRLCTDAGVSFDPVTVLDSLVRHLTLIREWNRYSSLVSIGDAESGLASHCVDSISVAPSVKHFMDCSGATYVDIGAGGGFPAIPLSILFPELAVNLIERNAKKVVFLKKVIASLGLSNVAVVDESFEGRLDGEGSKVITARAIEKPALVIPGILDTLDGGDVFLCQSEAVREVLDRDSREYSFVEVEDAFSASGMRRNRLYQIRALA